MGTETTMLGGAPTGAPAAGETPPTTGDTTPPVPPAEGETPPVEGQTAEGTKPAETAPAPIEIKLPDGVEADPELLEALKSVAKDSEHAQKLADAYVAHQTKAQAATQEAWAKTQKEWVDSLKADPDVGGAAFDANLQTATKAMQRFGSPELSQFLNESGLGNHPELVKLAVRIGKAISEDSIAGTSNQPSGARSEDDLLREKYPSMFKE